VLFNGEESKRIKKFEKIRKRKQKAHSRARKKAIMYQSQKEKELSEKAIANIPQTEEPKQQ